MKYIITDEPTLKQLENELQRLVESALEEAKVDDIVSILAKDLLELLTFQKDVMQEQVTIIFKGKKLAYSFNYELALTPNLFKLINEVPDDIVDDTITARIIDMLANIQQDLLGVSNG